MRHGSLFSGIGGFDLAAEWMGWENVFHCEWNPFGQRVLHHYWPNAETFTDITKTDFTKYHGSIDIISGGFPCQPYSSAGKRKGKEDERHLWPEMLRAIREISPSYVVGENVRGLTNWNGGMVFDEVCSELESIGYQVAPVIIPACSVGAPHRRERIWFVAHADGAEQRNNRRTNNREAEKVWRENQGDVSREFCSNGDATNATGFGFCGNGTAEQSQLETFGTWNGMGAENATNTLHKGLQGGQKIDRWQKHNAERRGNGLDIRTDGKNINGKFPSNFQNFPTESPICGGDDGLPTELDSITFSKWRNESIKAYGNAVCPQVVFEIFKAIEKTI